MKNDRESAFRALAVPVLLALLVAVHGLPASAGPAAGRLLATVVDESGEPVPGLKVKLVPADDSGNPARTFTTDKKGRFSHGFVPIGVYTIELAAPGLFAESMTYLDLDNRMEVRREDWQAHPQRGLPEFRVPLGHEIRLEITVGSEEERTELAQQVGLAEAKGPLQKIQEQFTAGDMQAVVETATKVIEGHPDLGVAHYLQGLALSRLDRDDEAIPALRRGLELAPEHQGIAGALGTVLLREARRARDAGRDEAAQALFADSEHMLAAELRQFGPVPIYLANHAAALKALGRPDALIDTLQQLLELEPDRVVARLELVEALAAAERFEEARATLADNPRDDRPSAEVAYNLAAKLYNKDRTEEAIEVAELGLEFDPDFAPLYRLLGRAHFARGEVDLARQRLGRFLELSPADDPTLSVEREMMERLERAGDRSN